MVENGHIYAPVSTDDISSVLGENSHDVGTLCTSENINPYSIIRPSYASGPGVGPEHFRDGFDGTQLPDSGSEDWFYTKGRWGYAVPTVGNPQSINVIKDKAWFHFDPTGDSWFCMTHFDGYRHNAKSRLPMTATISTGAKIGVVIIVGDRQDNILSDTGKGNNGGVVAIPEVLGNVRIGCTVYEGGICRGSFISPTPIDDNMTGTYEIITDITAVANRSYTIVPWATDGESVNQVGAHYYGLMMSKNFAGSISGNTTAKATPSIGLKIVNEDTYVSQQRIEFEVTLNNPTGSGLSSVTFTNFRLYKGANQQVPSGSFFVYDPSDDSTSALVLEGHTKIMTGICTDASLMDSSRFATLYVKASCSGVSGDVQSNTVHLGDLSGMDVV